MTMAAKIQAALAAAREAARTTREAHEEIHRATLVGSEADRHTVLEELSIEPSVRAMLEIAGIAEGVRGGTEVSIRTAIQYAAVTRSEAEVRKLTDMLEDVMAGGLKSLACRFCKGDTGEIEPLTPNEELQTLLDDALEKARSAGAAVKALFAHTAERATSAKEAQRSIPGLRVDTGVGSIMGSPAGVEALAEIGGIALQVRMVAAEGAGVGIRLAADSHAMAELANAASLRGHAIACHVDHEHIDPVVFMPMSKGGSC